MPSPHTHEVIGDELYDSLVDWNIDEKVSTITLDNCSSNDAAIPYLVRKIGKTKLMADGKFLHMRCCAHILNLIVKDGLEKLKDAIENFRDSVAYWTATPKRLEKFEEIAKYVNVKTEKKIALDCKTRWNSTYIMLSTALPYKAIFMRASRVDRQYTCCPTESEFQFAADVVERLKIFNDISVLFSGTDYVTANMFFYKICEVRSKIKEWSSCGNPFIEEMSDNMEAKFRKYWTEIQGLMGIATLLDPRFKHHMLLYCFEVLQVINPDEEVTKVKDTLSDLMLEYHTDEDASTSTSTIKPTTVNSGFLSSFTARVASKQPSALRFKSELDRYIDDEMVDIQTEGFNILDWWKVAGTRYPTLRMIARDIFAIPITTVASESAFSTSGRVLSEHRSRLTSQMLEALMCSQDWIRNKYKGLFVEQFLVSFSCNSMFYSQKHEQKFLMCRSPH